MDDSNVECSLPPSDQSFAFISLSLQDRLKVVELGMKLLETGNRQLQYWNDEEWEVKMTAVTSEKDTIIKRLRTDLKAQKKECENVVSKQAETNRTLAVQIRGETQALYNNEVLELRGKVERLEAQIAKKSLEYGELHQSLYASFQEQMEAKEFHREERVDKLRQRYEDLLREEKQLSRNNLIKNQNSTIKGQAGEDFTVHELNRRFPKAEFEDTRKQKGRGDFVMKEGSLCMLIETKNYKNNVTRPEIDKFYRDMGTNLDVQCGLFLSLNSGICAKDDFHFEVIENKPVIFLRNVSDNMKNIDAATQILKLVLKTEAIDLSSEETIGKLKNHIPTIKRNWNKMRLQIQKFEKAMLECVFSQEGIVKDIFAMIDVKY